MGTSFRRGAFVETGWQIGDPVIWKDTEGNIGASGIVVAHQANDYLQVDFYDDLNPTQDTSLGTYTEKFKIIQNQAKASTLEIAIGLLPKKDVPFHNKMWDQALKIIKELSEKS